MNRGLLILSFAWSAAGAQAQGNLTPPGAPAPSMRTLQQVEPRTPISSLPFTIAQPGSYYFETNLTGVAAVHNVTISASDVTLDLMGFALEGVTNSLDGITVSGIRRNILIRNGVVRGCGGDGVDTDLSDNSKVVDIRAFGNRLDGIRAGQYAVVDSCLVAENGRDGIRTFRSAIVTACGSSSNGANGIVLGPQSKAADCLVAENRTNGIFAATDATIAACQAYRNDAHGILVGANCVVRDCHALDNTGAGISATGNQNNVENNHLTAGNIGLRVRGRENRVSGNFVQGNSDNYDLAATNSLDLLLCELPETIDWPARLRLAGDLTSSSGLVIDSDNVTVDLNGFALIGSSSGTPGINVISSCNNLIIRNGSVSGWVGEGIDASDADNSIFEQISVFNNGLDGLRVGNGCSVTHCSAKNNGRDGIVGEDGCSVDNCTAFQNSRTGINFVFGGTIHDSAARDNTGNGFVLGGESLVYDCASSQNSSNGFIIGAMSVTRDNNAAWNTFDGFRFSGEKSRIEGNHSAFNTDDGFDAAGGSVVRNIFIRNTATGNGDDDYDINANNSIGAIVDVSTSVITNENPWVNFRY